MARIHGAIEKNGLPTWQGEVKTRIATPEEIESMCGPRRQGERVSKIVGVCTMQRRKAKGGRPVEKIQELTGKVVLVAKK